MKIGNTFKYKFDSETSEFSSFTLDNMIYSTIPSHALKAKLAVELNNKILTEHVKVFDTMFRSFKSNENWKSN